MKFKNGHKYKQKKLNNFTPSTKRKNSIKKAMLRAH